MSRLTRDGTAEPVSRDQILRRVRRQGNIHFPGSADPRAGLATFPVDPYSAAYDDHTDIHTYHQVFIHPCFPTPFVPNDPPAQCAESRSLPCHQRIQREQPPPTVAAPSSRSRSLDNAGTSSRNSPRSFPCITIHTVTAQHLQVVAVPRCPFPICVQTISCACRSFAPTETNETDCTAPFNSARKSPSSSGVADANMVRTDICPPTSSNRLSRSSTAGCDQHQDRHIPP